MHIEIKKAKIKRKIFLAYEYKQTVEGTQNEISTSSNAPIHPDLEEKFNALAPHFAFLTEEITKTEAKTIIEKGDEDALEELLKKFRVTGLSISDSGGEEGVVITGNKTLETGKVVNFNTPFTKYYDDMDGYEYGEQLSEVVDALKSEVLEYMDGKQAQSNQLEMFGEDGDEFEPGDDTETEDVDFETETDAA